MMNKMLLTVLLFLLNINTMIAQTADRSSVDEFFKSLHF